MRSPSSAGTSTKPFRVLHGKRSGSISGACSTSTWVMVPVVGVYSSYLLLDEHVGYAELVALLLVLSALALVLIVPALKRPVKS